jgi:translocation and assembly module TamB
MAVVTLVSLGLYFWMSTAQFEDLVRKRLIAELEQSTGGRVEVAAFHWRLLRLEAEADGVVIHGNEAPTDAPYARIDRLSARVSLLGFWSPSVRLSNLDIDHSSLHLITYEDGSTNQPHPVRPPSSATQNLNTFFDLQAGHLSLEQGTIDYDNRAAAFDFQNRWEPLDFQANDVSLLLSYIPASVSTPETYRIEAGATDFVLSRGVPGRVSRRGASKPVTNPLHGYLQATLDLTRSVVFLRSLRLTARARNAPAHTLEATGSLQDFTHPHWQAKVKGDLDMKLLDPVLGYPFAPEGIAHLDLDSAGENGTFRADGAVHIENGAYIGTGVVATGIHVDAHVHADPARLTISSVVVRLRQGGQMEGIVDLSPWLPSASGAATMQASGPSGARAPADSGAVFLRPQPPTIPVNGKVTAQFKDVALDTILDMVSQPPFQRLGIGTLINGPATAIWSKGDTQTVVVIAAFNLSPPDHSLAGEAPASGVVDGTYTQRNGFVDLRKLDVNLPASQLQANGNMGAYPLTSPSVLSVNFHSRNLGEFDSVLRSLGLKRNGKSGTAALPVALSGQADFQGNWTGSLANPRIAGTMNATQLALEVPSPQPAPSAPTGQTQPVPSQFVHLDSVEATGSYSAAHIAIDHALLLRGTTKLALSGSLIAVPEDTTPSKIPVFDVDSRLHLRLEAGKSRSRTFSRSFRKTCPLPAPSMPIFKPTGHFVPSADPAGCNLITEPFTVNQ